MTQEIKKNIFASIVYLCIIILIYFILIQNKYIFGSVTDFEAQHYLFPEYFRNLFYHTKDLFPDFAFNLGAGQNIYYFSYYGLLNPIILFSYLFPMIKMLDYIIVTNLLIIYLSTIFFYFYLRKNNYNFKTSFITAFLFLCAGPLIFHAHRHLMFMNYMPFLIIGLYGIDKYLNENKSFLLISSLTLMIFTSYYYSVGGLIALFLYGIYRYIQKESVLTFKKFFRSIFDLAIPFIIAVMIGAVIILPTLYTLLNGRDTNNSTISLLELFKPSQYLLYNTYSMGLTLITLLALIGIIISKNKANRFLAIILLIISIFPIFNYILNGTLYINGKALIPFIPLVLIITAEFLNKFFIPKFNLKQEILLTYLIISSFIICLNNNKKDHLILKEEIDNSLFNNYANYIEELTFNDPEIFRINNSVLGKSSINKVANILEYKTTLYSSTSNKYYDHAYKELFNNQLEYRNKFMLNSSRNILFQIFMNEKYILTTSSLGLDYELIKKDNGINIYRNNNTLPLGYATNNIINEQEFKLLDYPNNVINMLQNIVVSSKKTTSPNLISLKPINLKYELINKENVEIQKEDDIYFIEAKSKARAWLDLQEDFTNKIVFIRFKNAYNPSCGQTELTIKINDVSNKLTCSSWKYHNQNITFDYVLTEPEDLKIEFAKGNYKLTDLEIYVLDYNEIKNIRDNIDPFIIDKDQTKGDKIIGKINVTKNGYFTLSIPYDQGFKIMLDNKEVAYEKVNGAFIGFPINEGTHEIIINYEAPYKKLGLTISGIGIISLLIFTFISKRRKK